MLKTQTVFLLISTETVARRANLCKGRRRREINNIFTINYITQTVFFLNVLRKSMTSDEDE